MRDLARLRCGPAVPAHLRRTRRPRSLWIPKILVLLQDHLVCLTAWAAQRHFSGYSPPPPPPPLWPLRSQPPPPPLPLVTALAGLEMEGHV
ncbi:uncharacterized protein LOC105061924 isoform X4 [Camelus bactrianus]|uniref:Uncharacterized protein LOC105061924 isoform X4 n=1 Tax=Camelus bactrianus TaxID=9837 RepID=A0AC58PF90_CAMBA